MTEISKTMLLTFCHLLYGGIIDSQKYMFISEYSNSDSGPAQYLLKCYELEYKKYSNHLQGNYNFSLGVN